MANPRKLFSDFAEWWRYNIIISPLNFSDTFIPFACGDGTCFKVIITDTSDGKVQMTSGTNDMYSMLKNNDILKHDAVVKICEQFGITIDTTSSDGYCLQKTCKPENFSVCFNGFCAGVLKLDAVVDTLIAMDEK